VKGAASCEAAPGGQVVSVAGASAKSSRFRCHLIKIRQLTGEEVIVNTASLAFVQATLNSHVEFIEHKIAVEESDAYRRKASAALIAEFRAAALNYASLLTSKPAAPWKMLSSWRRTKVRAPPSSTTAPGNEISSMKSDYDLSNVGLSRRLRMVAYGGL
jgi:hypothetical protein